MINELAALRVRAGLSVEDLALMTGYSARQVQRWEAGDGAPREAAVQLLRSMVSAAPEQAAGRFNFIDLFAGMVGIRKGFDANGGHITEEHTSELQAPMRISNAVLCLKK